VVARLRLPEDLAASSACDLAIRWGVDLDVMERTQRAAIQFERETGRSVQIISGGRTPAEQNALRRKGRPTADNDRSTHLSCPATGIDVTLGFAPVGAMKATWGRIVVFEGLRWGGGSSSDSSGIPSDWPHVDRGPRVA